MDCIQTILIGQPNVGKSTLFTRMTGVGVISSNYPGTTVEFEESIVNVKGVNINVRDLPGTYSLSANSDDEKVVIDSLKNGKNDTIVTIVDSTNPEPGLALALEVSELNDPMIVVLNKYDARRNNIDVQKLEAILGIPVIPVSAKTGEGVDDLMAAIAEGRACTMGHLVSYDGHIMGYVDQLMAEYPDITRGVAIKLLEGSGDALYDVSEDLESKVSEMRNDFISLHEDNILVHIARDRYGDAHVITLSVVEKSEKKQTLGERVSDMIISPATGIPILVAVLLATFSILIFFGGFLADLIEHAYAEIVGTAIIDFGKSIGGGLGEAIFTGIDSSISAILGLVIPYIMVFYIVLGILEDSGYLPRAVVLLDTTLHRIGLHGNAFIPMMVGLGCNVPAVLATRSVRSHRERLILCTIICMAVPCSAQLATIAGVTGNFAGAGWALAILAILVILGFTIGCVLNRRLRFEPSNLAMELPALQMPSLKGTLKKTWMRTSDFFKLAVPLLIVGSIVVQLLIHYGFLDLLVDPMSWLTSGLLGLPAITIIAFIVGIVRKEMSYGMLVVLAASQGITDMSQFMTPAQYVVFGLVMAIYVPCLSTIVALHKEMGVRDTAIIFVSAILVAIVLGSVFNLILPFVM